MEVNLIQSGIEQFLEKYFYTYFRDGNQKNEENPTRILELILTPQCNLKCSYCYLWKNEKQLFTGCTYDKEKILSNLRLILQWLEQNHFCPEIDLFSGELFAQTIGYEVLEEILNHQRNIPEQYRIASLVIPTNMTFLCSDELTDKVNALREQFESLNIGFYLSASIDGKYIETNRSYSCDLDIQINVNRDDAYYDKLFDYCAKYNILFHPMIYSKNISKWKQNFLWFKENMEKHGMSVWSLYLLEVRNEEWTQTEILEFQEFLGFLYDQFWEKCEKDPKTFLEQLYKNHCNLNILGTVNWHSSFGISCSLQGSLCIRLEDLAVPPCHRTAYPQFMYGHFIPDTDKVLTFEVEHPELMVTTLGISTKSLPYCAECPINGLCLGPCIGSQYESNKNLFVPIPTVCALETAKIITAIKKMEEFGALNSFLNSLSQQDVEQVQYLRRNSLVKSH